MKDMKTHEEGCFKTAFSASQRLSARPVFLIIPRGLSGAEKGNAYCGFTETFMLLPALP